MRAHTARTAALTTLAVVLPGLVLTAVLLPGSAGAAGVACQGVKATLVGTEGEDTLEGTKGNDVIVSLGGDDVVYGRGGDDLVCGGYGSDRLFGGPGADQLYGGFDRYGDDPAGTFLVGDVLNGGEGDDRLAGVRDTRDVESHRRPDVVSYADAPVGVVVDLSVEPGVATGEGTDSIAVYDHIGVIGSAYADTVTGSDGDNWIQGGDGDDQLLGGEGEDIIYAEQVGGTGDDLVQGGIGWDVLGSYAGRDDVRGGKGNDFVEAYSDAPTLVSGDLGNDYVAQNVTPGSGAASSGGGGRDLITFYGALLEGNSPRTEFAIDLRSGTTSATLDPAPAGTVGGFEEYRLVGNLQWRFHGTTGPDRVWGITGGPLRAWTFGGDDWVTGTDRDDFVNAGKGDDEVQGRRGHDTCKQAERGTC
jgi:Ca2+-binding RTX toxin-like protein